MGSSNTLVPARVRVYLNAVGAVAPVDLADPAADWINVGNTTTDGLQFSTNPTFDTVTSAQSDYPIRTFQTADAATVAVVLEEWTASNVQAAFGGGEIEETTAGSGVFKFTPPGIGDHLERALLIDVIDGSVTFRYIFPRVMQTDGVQVPLGKGAAATLPLSLAVQGDDGVDAWYLLTNSTAFDTAAS